jgi:hypothetical protein
MSCTHRRRLERLEHVLGFVRNFKRNSNANVLRTDTTEWRSGMHRSFLPGVHCQCTELRRQRF